MDSGHTNTYTSDFWDGLKPESFNKRDHSNAWTFSVSQRTSLKYLNVTTIKGRRYFFIPIYTILITNNEPALERDRRAFHEDSPGHVTTAHRFYRFRKAIGTHLAALHRLDDIGY